MKKMIITAVCAMMAATLAYGQGAVADTAMRTVIRVTLQVEKHIVRTGPYARFAQKYLGVIAPLSDKEINTIKGAALSYALVTAGNDNISENRLISGASAPTAISHIHNQFDFVKVPIDRRDFTQRSAEDAARDAATTIFALRKTRYDLVTGAAGENVFGPGLRAALDEIDRMEEEYLSLFMGKQSVQTLVRVIEVKPNPGEVTKVVCRFNETDGVVAANNLSGAPIFLELRSQADAAAGSATAKKGKKGPYAIRLVPAWINCRLMDGKTELAAERMPIYQMGHKVEVEISSPSADE